MRVGMVQMRQARCMIRMLAFSTIAVAGLAAFPAQAQTDPQLEGAPGTHATDLPPLPPKPVERPAPKKPQPAAVKTTSVQTAQKLAQQAEAQKAEQARLARQADDLKARQAALDARAASLAAEEKRLAQLHAEAAQGKLAQQTEAQKAAQAQLAKQAEDLKARQAALDARAASLAAEENRLAQLHAEEEAKLAARQAELTKQQAEAGRIAERPGPTANPRGRLNVDEDVAGEGDANPRYLRNPTSPRLVFAAARRACTSAAEDEAAARHFENAAYDGEPRLYQRRGWELRGRMRLENGRGYLLVDTVCEVDDTGQVKHFSLFR